MTPRIDYNLLAEPVNAVRLRQVVRLARGISASEPVASMIGAEVTPGVDTADDGALDAAIHAGITTFYHGTATAPMGATATPKQWSTPAAECAG